MINYNPKSWFQLIFQLGRSQFMRFLAPYILAIGLLTAVMTWLLTEVWVVSIPKEVNIHTIVGITLGLLLVFRTNTAYDRWWEGRRLFGTLTNNCRNVALKLNAALPLEDQVNRDFFFRTISNFYYAHKENLRGKCDPDDMDLDGLPYAETIRDAQHRPAHIASHMHERLNQLLKVGVIDGDQFIVISRDVESFVDVMGACERIRNTPIPYSYSSYIKKVIFIYLVTMPISIISSLGYWSVPMIMFATYVIAGIEVLAEEIEDPFGTDVNDLDTDGMARNIRKNVREILVGPATEKEKAS